MKFQTDESRAWPRFDVPFNSTDPDLAMISGFNQNPEKEIELISELVDQPAPPRKSPEPLIKVPGVIITPDRDARYRPPTEMTSDVMERLS